MAPRAQKVLDTITDQYEHLLHKLFDEGCILLLQRVPHYTAGISATTCRHLECPYEDSIFKGGDFLLSLEKAERCDPLKNSLSYKAIASLSQVLASGRNHQKGKRGLGERGEERWHLLCFESLCREYRKRKLLLDPEGGISTWAPSMLFGQHIIADERGIPAYPGKFNVDSPYQFGLELWKATQLFDDRQEHGAHFKANLPPHIPLPNILIEGRDRQSLYLTNEARNYRGRMPWGEIAEILVDDVRGVTLGEMTRRVSAILTPKYQARRELNKQEELAKRASKVSTELEENRSGDRQSPEVTHDQPHSAEGTTVSLIGANTPALAISPLDASTASADGNKRPSTPKAGLIPSSASPPTAAGAANKVPDAIKNKTTRHNSGPMPPPAMPTEVTSHDSLTPTALEPPRTSLKCNRNSPDVAGQPAGIGQARETDEDGEDDVVFVGRKKKVVKVTNDSSGDQGRGAPETRRKPKRGLGSWW